MPTATPTRDTDRQQLPAPLRRDVRLLGGILGEVLREAGGQELLDDTERLRHAVIDARRGQPGGPGGGAGPGRAPDADPAGDEIAALVASWPLDRAELVARAFTVYFHLSNLAEELHRVRALRERTPATPRYVSRWPPRSASSAGQGPEQLESCSAAPVHPVLTAHPTEARRRAVATALRRITDLVTDADDPGTARPSRWTSGACCARRLTCCGAPRRCGPGR